MMHKSAMWLRTERGWVIVVSVIVVFITCLPSIYAWLRTPADWVYTGQVLDPEDGNTYLNKMKQGAEGQWLFSIAYTSEPHSPIFLHPYYLSLGHLANLLRLPLAAMFQISRAVNGLLFLGLLYVFIGQFQPDRAQRRRTFLLVVASSGLGWVLAFLNVSSTDLHIPESITFLTLLLNPHFPLATAGILFSLLMGLRALHQRSWPSAIICGLSQTVLLFLHPYDIAITGLVLSGYFGLGCIKRWWPWQVIRYLIASYLVCVPALLYNVSLYLEPGVWHLWQTQAPPPTPPVGAFIGGYGLLLPLAVLGGVSLWRTAGQPTANSRTSLLVIWVIAIPALMFLPIPVLAAIQVRFSEGLHIPVAILASYGVTFALERFKFIRWAPMLIILSLSNVLVLISSVWRLSTPQAPWFYTQDEVAVMQWLDGHSRPDDVVLSLNESGNYLPVQANVHVYVGHPYETIDYQSKVARSEAFFAEKLTDTAERELLSTNRITWVFIGERELASAFKPETKAWLVPRFSQGRDAVYAVNLP